MTFDQTLPLLRQIGRYQILRELGRGTMGIVYEAFDPKLERTVALKTVRLEAGDTEHREFEERFQREAKSAARLNHPNIVTIHDAGEEDGVAYIAMEFLEGKSLRELLDSGTPLSNDDLLAYAIQMADALDYAHRFDIVHRDVKPGNIVVSSQGRVKISDFGIAQLPSGNLTQAGTILGTPKYMSPEQVRGERLDGRSDIFSLGVILYEIFAGKAPFTGDSLAAIMYQVLHVAPLDPTILAPTCPPGIRQIVARCLAKDKAERYPQAGDIAADLRRHHDLTPDPVLIASAFSALPAGINLAAPPEADHTQPLHLAAADSPNKGWRKPRLWLAAGALLGMLVLGYWALKPAARIPESQSGTATTSARPASAGQDGDSAGEARQASKNKEGTTKKSAPAAKNETKTAITSKKEKSFWRRQVDCLKHGVCDKAAPPPDPPPGFSP